jgi:peptide/nickel transport system permease protein
MTVDRLGGLAAIEGWTTPTTAPLFSRIRRGLFGFARRKPLGFICGIIVVFLIVIGDLFPIMINGAFGLSGVNVRLPLVAEQIAPYDFEQQHLRNRLEAPSSSHWLGTDSLGRDILSRLLYGARVSIIVAFGAVAISQIMATVIGITSAYYGSWFDTITQRFVDMFQALPNLVVLITILGMFGSGIWQMTVAIGLLAGPPASRLIRGQVIAIMATPYIEGARVVGARDGRIMLVYVLPNVMALVILGATLRLGSVILTEASLSFLGFGLPPPFPSWGQMLSLEGRQYMLQQPLLALLPGIAIAISVFSFNLLGDALRDVLDPRLRGGR